MSVRRVALTGLGIVAASIGAVAVAVQAAPPPTDPPVMATTTAVSTTTPTSQSPTTTVSQTPGGPTDIAVAGDAGPNAPAERGEPVPADETIDGLLGVRSQVFGYSVQGRPLVVNHRRGSATASRRILAVGVIHGDERAGKLVTARLATMDLPADLDLYWVDSINPDGEVFGRPPDDPVGQKNAHGVNLNRNFPTADWNRDSFYGISSKFYAGPSAGSEPETKAAMALLSQIRPQATVWYHMPLNTVDCKVDRVGTSCRDYAAAVGLGVSFIPVPGTATDWTMTNGYGVAFVVEFNYSMPSAATVTRHVDALLALQP